VLFAVYIYVPERLEPEMQRPRPHSFFHNLLSIVLDSPRRPEASVLSLSEHLECPTEQAGLQSIELPTYQVTTGCRYFMQDPRDGALTGDVTGAQCYHGTLHSSTQSKNSCFKPLPGTRVPYSAASWAKERGSNFPTQGFACDPSTRAESASRGPADCAYVSKATYSTRFLHQKQGVRAPAIEHRWSR
jgi:hypothetical protein